MTSTSSTVTNRGNTRWLPWLGAALALLPLIILHPYFAQLYWFGDDFDMLDQIDQGGFWSWTFRAFAENFVPLFKLLWGALAVEIGSYPVLIWGLWLTHALNVALLGSLLLRAGLSARVAILSMLVFGLTPGNLESLAWSVQWSSLQATTFFLLSALWFLKNFSEDHRWGAKKHLVLACMAGASALCFSRGVLTGLVFALMSLFPLHQPLLKDIPGRLRSSLVCLFPALSVLGIMMFLADGNHRHLETAQLGDIGTFGFFHYSLNPLWRLLELRHFGWTTAMMLCVLKTLFYARGLLKTQGAQRWLFATLVLWDLENSALMGIGRFQTGIEASVSMRYQYVSLVCLLPFVAFEFDLLWCRLDRFLSARFLRVAFIFGLLGLTYLVCRNWRHDIETWSGWRGRDLRALIETRPGLESRKTYPGIPSMSSERARELAKKYNLR